MHKAYALLAFLMARSVSGETSPLPTPKTLMAQIKAEGAKVVLKRLWHDNAAFDALCAAIETGDPAWLEIAERLRPASDAGITLSINYSVARALPKAPERVLALVGKEFRIDDICTSPFIEPKPGVAQDYQKRTIAALRKVSAPELLKLRDQCLARISVPLRTQ